MDVRRPKPHTCDVCMHVREMSEDVEGEKGENERGRRMYVACNFALRLC